MNKEIKFLMKFDTSEFDKAVENMQRKLKEVYRPADIAGAQRQTAQRLEGIGLGGMNKPSMDAYFKSIQSSRKDMDTLLQKYSKDQQNLIKDIAEHESRLKNNIRYQEAVNKGSATEIALLKEKKNIEENLFRMRENYMARNQVVEQTISARNNLGPKDKLERLMTAFGGGGMKGGIKEGSMMAGEWWKGLGMTGQAGMIISGLLAATKGVGMVGDMATAYHGLPLRVAGAQGSATQNIYGKEIQSIFSGNQAAEMAFGSEKHKAVGMAKEQNDAQTFWDRMASGKSAADASAYLVAHHLPKIAAATMAVSAIQHGVYGLGGGMMGESGARRQQMALGTFSKRNEDAYQSMSAESYAGNYAKAVEDLKSQNPLKTAAVGQFNQRSSGDLAFQRATGLNSKSFHGAGGFREQMINSGFTDDMGMDAAQGILSAGGSTRGAVGNAGLSMQAQRGFDLTNANSIIGKLSGQMGDSESTRQAFVQMLATGSRLGLDSSQFREENRKFMDAAVSIIDKSGATSQGDVASLMKMFGGFVGNESTPKGIEGAKNAYDLFVQQGSATSGASGAMKAGQYLSGALNKLGGQDKAKLANIHMDELIESNPVVQDIADRNGIPVDQLISEAKKAANFSISRNPQYDSLRAKGMGLRKQIDALPNTSANAHKRYDLTKQLQATENQFIGVASISTEGGGALGNDPVMARKYAKGMMDPSGNISDETRNIMKKLGDKDTGRDEDKSVQTAAESARLMLTAFQQFHDTIVPSAEAVGIFNGKILELVGIMMKIDDPKERAKFMKEHADMFKALTGPSEQSAPGPETK